MTASLVLIHGRSAIPLLIGFADRFHVRQIAQSSCLPLVLTRSSAAMTFTEMPSSENVSRRRQASSKPTAPMDWRISARAGA